ncbi:MAG: hypothetical protein ACJ74Z_04165 [Bryobacteraceae bacterium]
MAVQLLEKRRLFEEHLLLTVSPATASARHNGLAVSPEHGAEESCGNEPQSVDSVIWCPSSGFIPSAFFIASFVGSSNGPYMWFGAPTLKFTV